MKDLVVVEKGRNSWGAYVPNLPGCVAAAKTKANVLKLVNEAVGLHIEGLKEAGQRVPRPHSEAKIVVVKTA